VLAIRGLLTSLHDDQRMDKKQSWEKEMLIAYVCVNSDKIETICMHNKVITNSKGQHKYWVWLESDKLDIKEVWHKREEGWSKLLQKSLRKLDLQKKKKKASIN
jgi:hypothetical protein